MRMHYVADGICRDGRRGPATRVRPEQPMLDSPAETAGAVPVPDPGPRRYAAVSASAPDHGGGNPELRLAFAVLRRRKLPLIACSMLVPLLAVVAIRQTTPRYTATGALIYEPSVYKVRELQSIVQADPTTEALMTSQAEVLQSLHIAQQVAERGNLFADPEFNGSLRPARLTTRVTNWLRQAMGVETAPPPATVYGPVLDQTRSATLVAVQSALHATALPVSHIIQVTFTAEDPLVAAAAVNNAMDAYVKDQFAAKHRAVSRATAWLERRASELRTQVQDEENRIARYRADKHLSEGMHAAVTAEQITHLTEDLVRARSALANADGRLDAARGKAGAAAQAAVAPSVVQLRTRLEDLATQLQAQQGQLGPNHPEVQSLRRQIAGAERAVSAEIGRVVAATDAERRAAAERVGDAEANLHEAQQEAARAAEAQIPLNALLRDAEAARSQLQAILERIQQSAEQEAIESSEAHEISTAQPPQSPSSPRIVPLMAASVASGVMLGLLTVYALHLTDTTVQSGEDARAAAQRPCFALLPEISRRARGHLPICDYAARRPLTAFAEQIRALRAGLWLTTGRPRVVAITAARPSEGKSVLALALGRSAQLAGERVLAIECDLRQPSFARRLGGEGTDGLAEVLKGKAVLEEVVQQDALTGMAYIIAGRFAADVLGLFTSEKMARVIAAVRQDYDLVLLDAPPVQALTEARIAAAIADATLLCVRWRSTPRAVLHHALELLEEAHATVAGTVLTRVDPRAHVRSGYADAEVYHRRYRPYYRG
ncbi:MAG TPA: hypothetical protein VN702_01775 [Acetobacteraceae bacterium]|nr:hypothetical protein [Acetobacteraceae bacterium]